VTRVITVQPASYVDHITEDGTELTKLPYPFHAVGDRTGEIMNQELWQGRPKRVVGFVSDLHRQEVDLFWLDRRFLNNPQQVVGMYLVTQDSDGGMAVHNTAIETVEEKELP
jgi:hypothetical protein